MEDKNELEDEDELDDYDLQCEKMTEYNNQLLEMWADEMKNNGLKDNTIDRHLFNVDTFINLFLLSYDVKPMERGVSELDTFFGYWFIHKCVWSTPATVKSTATSIKKFYKSMMEHGKISADDYQFVCSDINLHMKEWQHSCALFNNGEWFRFHV